ncbi:MAG: ABC transporter permease [Verrucomicrobiota bacterium]|jgi:peptide/nickel transport system permease protein/oligopeptide transport system permease protein
MNFLFSRQALVSKLGLGLMIVLVIAGPLLMPRSYGLPGDLTSAPPSWIHLCGTDLNGRDMLFRILQGGRVSLLVGVCGAAISLVIGTTYGLIAGSAKAGIDHLMMRLVDILYSVPRLIFILILINAFNQHLQQFASLHGWDWLVSSSRIVILIFSLGLIEWLTMARIVRGQTLSIKERSYVAAAKVLGEGYWMILRRHIFPNLAGIVLVYLTLAIPSVIVDEAFLSFLGLGVQAPQSSWGSLLSEGAASINPLRNAWWMLLFPSLAMLSTLLALYSLGNSMRRSMQAK